MLYAFLKRHAFLFLVSIGHTIQATCLLFQVFVAGAAKINVFDSLTLCSHASLPLKNPVTFRRAGVRPATNLGFYSSKKKKSSPFAPMKTQRHKGFWLKSCCKCANVDVLQQLGSVDSNLGFISVNGLPSAVQK